MNKNKKLKEMIENKYKEMKGKNISEDFLNKEALGDIKIFINKKPQYTLPLSEEFGTDKVYVGSETMYTLE